MRALEFQWLGTTLYLHPDKAMYWSEESMLLLADLHLDKAAHFRRHGLAAPSMVMEANLQRLVKLITEFQPKRILFLGDLFHSKANSSWLALKQFIDQYPDISFELVAGNHDIMPDEQYTSAGLILRDESYVVSPFVLTHHPLETKHPKGYFLAGHIHPCVRLAGEGRQSLRLPCFYFGEYGSILPAFGLFTGWHTMQVKSGDRVFGIGEGEVFEL